MDAIQLLEKRLDKAALGFWLSRDETGKCRAPFALDTERGPVLLPCKNCLPCRRRARNAMVGRVVGEAFDRPESTVMTLTYSDEALPLMSEITPEWINGTWHALRNRLIRRYGPIRYVAVAQIGGNTYRFHWHVICLPPFGSVGSVVQKKHWVDPDKLWPHGHRIVDAVHSQSAGYVFEYLVRRDKGTVWRTKSQLLGESYFRRWLSEPKLPFVHGPVFNVGEVLYPMDRRFREIANEAGYLAKPSFSETSLQVVEWIRDGYLRRPLDEERDREARLARERREAVRKAQNDGDPAIAALIASLRDASKSSRSLQSPGELVLV